MSLKRTSEPGPGVKESKRPVLQDLAFAARKSHKIESASGPQLQQHAQNLTAGAKARCTFTGQALHNICAAEDAFVVQAISYTDLP